MDLENYLDNEAIQNMQISERVADSTLGILHHILMIYSKPWEEFSYGCCVRLDIPKKTEITKIIISALQHEKSSQLIDKIISISRYGKEFDFDKKFFEGLTKYEYKFIFLNEKPLLKSFLEQLQEPNISKYKDAPADIITDRINDFFENQNDTDKKTIIFVDENSIDNAAVFQDLLARLMWKAVFVWFRPLSDFDGEVSGLDKICQHGGDFRHFWIF